MALTNNEKQSNGNLVILKPVDRDAEKHPLPKPFFSVTKKVDGKWTKDPETYTNVSGTLSKVELEQNDYQGDINKVAKIYLKDGDDLYLLDLRYSIASRGLFNSLLGLKEYTNVKVSIYRNKAGYLSYYVRQNESDVAWAFTREQVPAPVKVMFKGKERSDFSDIDSFYEGKLQELSKKLGGSGEIGQRTDKVAEKKEEVKTDKKLVKENLKIESPADDQVPF